MDATPLVLLLCFMLHSTFIDGQELKLSFNTPLYNDTNDYYAHVGENVNLTCTVAGSETRVYMYKTRFFSILAEKLVENSELVKDLTYQPNKYSFQSDGGKYRLTIHSLDISDSLFYGCQICSSFIFCRRTVYVYLDVKETVDHSRIPDFCDLISNTGGIFFTENDLTVRCPILPFNITASNGSFIFIVEFEMENYGTNSRLLTIKNLTTQFNGTKLSCFSQNGDMSEDYCRRFPNISVFNDLSVRISPRDRIIRNGENVTFSCYSHPFLPSSVRWNILDSNVTFDDVSVSFTPEASRIAIHNVKFHNSTSSSLTLFCNVTIGPKSSFGMASVYPGKQEVVTTHVTSLISDISLKHKSVSESDKSVSPVYIIVPIAVVTGILVIIILWTCYIKLWKSVPSNEADRQNGYINQDTDYGEESAYDTRTIEGTELGFINRDSEIVDNVAYVSYNEDFKEA